MPKEGEKGGFLGDFVELFPCFVNCLRGLFCDAPFLGTRTHGGLKDRLSV